MHDQYCSYAYPDIFNKLKEMITGILGKEKGNYS